MNREAAVEKVKKLLRLSKSSNEHEAAAAMRQAQALMRQHQIEEAEAAGADAQIDPIEEVASDARRGKTPPVDLVALAALVSDAFGTHSLIRVRQKLFDVSWIEPRFIGPTPRGELSAYAFNVLWRQLSAAKRVHLRRVRNRKNRAARGDHFGLGFVDGVRALLNVWDLSVEDAARMELQLRATHPNMTHEEFGARTGARSNLPTHNDHHAGRTAGRNAQLHRGVAGERQRQIGGPKA